MLEKADKKWNQYKSDLNEINKWKTFERAKKCIMQYLMLYKARKSVVQFDYSSMVTEATFKAKHRKKSNF